MRPGHTGRGALLRESRLCADGSAPTNALGRYGPVLVHYPTRWARPLSPEGGPGQSPVPSHRSRPENAGARPVRVRARRTGETRRGPVSGQVAARGARNTRDSPAPHRRGSPTPAGWFRGWGPTTRPPATPPGAAHEGTVQPITNAPAYFPPTHSPGNGGIDVDVPPPSLHFACVMFGLAGEAVAAGANASPAARVTVMAVRIVRSCIRLPSRGTKLLQRSTPRRRFGRSAPASSDQDHSNIPMDSN